MRKQKNKTIHHHESIHASASIPSISSTWVIFFSPTKKRKKGRRESRAESEASNKKKKSSSVTSKTLHQLPIQPDTLQPFDTQLLTQHARKALDSTRIHQDRRETCTNPLLHLIFSLLDGNRLLQGANRLSDPLRIHLQRIITGNFLLATRALAEGVEIGSRIGLGGVQVCVELALSVGVGGDGRGVFPFGFGHAEGGRVGDSAAGCGELAGGVDDGVFVEEEAGDALVGEVIAQVAEGVVVVYGEGAGEGGCGRFGIGDDDFRENV